MSQMFSGYSSVESLDVSSFETSNVEDTSYLFNNCSNIYTLDISNFDTSKVTNMEYMFNECSNVASLEKKFLYFKSEKYAIYFCQLP